MTCSDPHSYTDDLQPAVHELALRAHVDFEAKVLRAQATLRFAKPAAAASPLDLDTRDLDIAGAELSDGRPVPYTLQPADPILGARLRLDLPAGAADVTIRYTTSPSASALQWLTPAQTAGGKHPFLFSQCQAIHARSVAPLQDTPRRRIRYSAELDVPAELTALMAAAQGGKQDVGGGRAVFSFTMPQPIPPYLLALAVGDLASRDLGPRSRVWAEPALVEQAAWEFAGVDGMLRAAEQLFGPYEWERFDILTMPPSFPYGGMENPRLTFLTPTLLAGDRSLVSVVAHELAHSWTGNLVTNANAEHFWLNEGFTRYAENRILEVIEGPEMAALHTEVGRAALQQSLTRFAKQPELQKLRTHLSGVDPDEAFSSIPYEKGCLFLCTLERAVGRPKFDAFLRRYIDTWRFGTLTTEEFTDFLGKELPGALEKVNGSAWLDEPGVPDNAPEARAARLDAIVALMPPASGATPRIPERDRAARFSALEWQIYLQRLPRPVSLDLSAALDERFSLSQGKNADVLCAWLEASVPSGHAPALAAAERLLSTTGRMKYLRPLYDAMARRPETRARARALFDRCRASSHPIAQNVVEGVLRQHGA